MTDTPAQELRAAADKLRRLATAEGLEPGPWLVHNRGGWPEAVYSKDSDVVLAETTEEIDAPKPHASYIAAMHPGVGRALAAWLDSWTGIDLYEAGSLPEDARHALAVARAILANPPKET